MKHLNNKEMNISQTQKPVMQHTHTGNLGSRPEGSLIRQSATYPECIAPHRSLVSLRKSNYLSSGIIFMAGVLTRMGPWMFTW